MATYSPRLEATNEELVQALRHVVAERGPDFVYPKDWKKPNSSDGGFTCQYVRPDGEGPACIIGAALAHLGVPLPALADFEGDGAGIVLSKLGIDGPQRSDIRLAYDQTQASQDAGDAWGIALALGLAEIEIEETR